MSGVNRRITVVDASGPVAAGLFEDRSFDAVATRETLEFDVSAHVYEEVAIRKTVIIRDESVTTVLRREEAEIVAAGSVTVAAGPIEG